MTPKLVAIVGGSGSGKSWLAHQLLDRFMPAGGLLSLDDFYLDQSHVPARDRGNLNFDHPAAIEWRLFVRCLDGILQGTTVELPKYDFETHTRRARGQRWAPRSLVILDGLWLLRRGEVRRRCALTVFVDCPEEVRLARRLARDCRQRGRTEASILRQFREQVAPMHNRFVASQARHADMVVQSGVEDSGLAALVKRVGQVIAAGAPGEKAGRA